MTLHKQITQKLKQTSHDELLKTMGYHNLKAGHQTLQKFLEMGNIYLFLKNGNFDMRYGSNEFLKHLLKALGLTSAGKDELKQYNNRLDAVKAMGNTPYIFIDTHFKRKGEPIHVLAMVEGRRHISIDKELLVFKSESEVLFLIGNIIQEHYILHHGKLNLWGKIYNYVYHSPDGKKFVFDIDGTLSQNQSEIMESRAELKIGNQKINFMIQEN